MEIRAYFPRAKRGNNTQLIIAQQRGGHGRVCQRSAPLRLLRSHSARRGPTEEAGQGFEVSLSLDINRLWDLSMGSAAEGGWVDGSRLLLEHLSERFYTLKWRASKQGVLTGADQREYTASYTARWKWLLSRNANGICWPLVLKWPVKRCRKLQFKHVNHEGLHGLDV